MAQRRDRFRAEAGSPVTRTLRGRGVEPALEACRRGRACTVPRTPMATSMPIQARPKLCARPGRPCASWCPAATAEHHLERGVTPSGQVSRLVTRAFADPWTDHGRLGDRPQRPFGRLFAPTLGRHAREVALEALNALQSHHYGLPGAAASSSL